MGFGYLNFGESFINRFVNFYCMELNFLKSGKTEVEVEIENLTLAEILRVYLSKDSSVEFVAWKREHLTEKPILKVRAKDVKSAVKAAVEAIFADVDEAYSSFKSL